MLSPTESELLLALMAGAHFKNNPAKPTDLLSQEPQDANAAGRHLVELELAARVHDSASPNALFLRITDAGVSCAGILKHEERKLTFTERLKTLPIGKGVWDVLKIGLGALVGVVATKFFGQ